MSPLGALLPTLAVVLVWAAGPSPRGVRERNATLAAACSRPSAVQRVVFESAKYPNVRRHFRRAVAEGWPRVLVLNRRRDDDRRDRLLGDVPTREGFDRDEYPPALGRGRGLGLMQGRHPRGWKASVRYVPSGENRSHGASMGNQLRPFCDGTRFRYVFR